MKTIPTRELIGPRLSERAQGQGGSLRETLAFYRVGSVDAERKVWDAPPVAARRSPCFEYRPGPASAWIRQGEIQAQEIDCRPYDKVRFRDALRDIRTLTRETPEVFEPEMKRSSQRRGGGCAIREMKKVPWNGATKWLTPDKAMTLLFLRGKGEDKFFSFFHKAGHILNDREGTSDERQQPGRPTGVRANAFAVEC